MENLRFQAIHTVLNRERTEVQLPAQRISEYFGSNVFNDEAMRKHLSAEAYQSIKHSIESGTKIDRSIADQVAASMQAWAIGKGATHFTHWFQPLTGATAEKHDTFFTITGSGRGMESFSGDALVQQESDASSFPSGGIRSTFEARGYTAWDPSSPAFIMEIGNGKTLCIPTIFVSFNGEALDYKAPLLKSYHLISSAALDVCHFFDKHVTRVYPTLGWEQEYFVVDEALFYARPDLLLTGRTLFGHASAKGQQLEDHYFGSIPERVYAFMLDLETEALKLGIPIKTRHNEVAPAQYECAPMFEDMNLSVDHNQLFMDLMDRISRRHKLRVLLHEKPFTGINGSGKHCNWSLFTNTGKNLLAPGTTPRKNLLFLTFFINIIKAVHEHADLLRASIASAGNDHRLGANEAPPAIMSVFIGSLLRQVLDEIEERVEKGAFDEPDKGDLRMEIHKMIPDLMKDNTDRNRTSPFAFTGNKFELRTVGSSANCAFPMTVLNTIVGHRLKLFKEEVDKLKETEEKKDAAILKVLKRYIDESRSILFEGDNYSKDWEKEAAKRGLSNIKTTPEALDKLVAKDNRMVFTSNHVFSVKELDARYEIMLENYNQRLQIEARILNDLVINQIIPAALKYQNELAGNISTMKEAGLEKDSAAQKELLAQIAAHIRAVKELADAMMKETEKTAKSQPREKAAHYCERIKPLFEKIREHADQLELLVEDGCWSLPKYRELLFIR
ncbi:MAG TPA: glutamine synthetase III [Chitinophagales bacterium]|nr:glutamine synthetase III [Chitinophagales bacterium]